MAILHICHKCFYFFYLSVGVGMGLVIGPAESLICAKVKKKNNKKCDLLETRPSSHLEQSSTGTSSRTCSQVETF